MQESKLEDESDQFYKATLPFCEPEPVLRENTVVYISGSAIMKIREVIKLIEKDG